ncbi:MAG: uroporphyrinogen decarboxylase family protein [Fimbriimonadales bacterium]
MTVCCSLRGATEFCMDLLEDPTYAEELLDFVTEAIEHRIAAFRRELGLPEVQQGFGWADDSVALLSVEQYREFVLPRHRRLVERFSKGGPNSVHLCGDATRHFRTLRDELNVRSFDTGFPVEFGSLRRQLGPDVEVLGGPSVPLLLHGSPDELARETSRILRSGITEGGRFILREGNNLAPGTPLENLWAMYETVRREGLYAA